MANPNSSTPMLSSSDFFAELEATRQHDKKVYEQFNRTQTNSVSDFLKELVVPITYAKGLFGAKQPVTMDSYPTDAQDFLRHLVRNNKNGPVGWNEWFKSAQNYAPLVKDGKNSFKNINTKGDSTNAVVSSHDLNFAVPVQNQFFHPMNQVHNTLGRFNISTDPKTQEYIINDKFNFEKDDSTHAVSPGPRWWDPRFPLAKLGNLIIPEGKPFTMNTGVYADETSYDASTGATYPLRK